MTTTWSITKSTARAKGMTPRDFSAEDLHAFLPADGSVTTIYESFGHVHGEERFARTHVRAIRDGVECLTKHVEDKGAWRVTLIHPLGAGRVVRILTR